MSKDQNHHHHHSHSGGHHHHHHSHGSAIGRMRFAFVLNLGFAIIELIGGYLTNSVAIMSDALHDFGDAMAMVIAIVMEKVSHKESDQKFSYGYRRFSVLGAVITGGILIVGSVFILVEAVPRLLNPQAVHANGMLLLAVFGVAVNGFAALRVSKGTSLNERMLMWHMIEDVMGWVLVLIGALVMKFWDVPQVDAGLAIALSLWILFNVFRNLREAMKVFLMAAPTGFSVEHVSVEIKKIPSVVDVHHAHLWSLDGENHIYTAHVVLDGTGLENAPSVKSEIKKRIKNFGIIEATIETEVQGDACSDPKHN
ncbi:cation diffusion facilitator family transporter [Bdellovibrio sp. HCB209]|uniref:cation diffusion facilitator family transporter n=1 Tax=Bdellovibrio sp. HCB209 TaxID=3394354 RepID=UPI0039B54727